jgi:hypothetical protein
VEEVAKKKMGTAYVPHRSTKANATNKTKSRRNGRRRYPVLESMAYMGFPSTAEGRRRRRMATVCEP